MKISVNFLPHGPNAAPEEAATVARIHIAIGNHTATDTRIDRQDHIIDHVIAPAYPLAEAIAYRWWTLLEGRGRTTTLRSMRAGYALPNIFIKPAGNGTIEIRCEPFSYDNPPIQFVNKAAEEVPVKTFENDMSQFIRVVIDRLREEKIGETPLSVRQSLIAASTADREQRDFCKAAGALGIDPYTCSDEIAAFIETASGAFQNDDLEEFLAGVTPENGINAIRWLREAEQHSDDWSILPAVEDCRRALQFRSPPGAPWTAGYMSARSVRKTVELNEHESVGELPQLASRLGNGRFHATEQSKSGLRGVSRVRPGKPQVIVAGNRRPENLLFAVVRTFGDAIHFGGVHRSPVTDQIGTYRQQLGRAFAAEFLAPVDEVVEMHSHGEAVEEIAAHFGVSDMVINHQIENRESALPA